MEAYSLQDDGVINVPIFLRILNLLLRQTVHATTCRVNVNTTMSALRT
jgi:hypothetical protein